MANLVKTANQCFQEDLLAHMRLCRRIRQEKNAAKRAAAAKQHPFAELAALIKAAEAAK